MGVPPDLQAQRLREQQERAQRSGARNEEELGGGGAGRISGGPTFGVPAEDAPPAADAVRSHDVVWSLDNPGDLGASSQSHWTGKLSSSINVSVGNCITRVLANSQY